MPSPGRGLAVKSHPERQKNPAFLNSWALNMPTQSRGHGTQQVLSRVCMQCRPGKSIAHVITGGEDSQRSAWKLQRIANKGFGKMDIKRTGSQPSGQGPAEYF